MLPATILDIESEMHYFSKTANLQFMFIVISVPWTKLFWQKIYFYNLKSHFQCPVVQLVARSKLTDLKTLNK